MASVLGDAKLEALVGRLHAENAAQEAGTSAFFRRRAQAGELSWDGLDAESESFMADKMVALEPEKAEFCYLTCRAIGARQVVEVGTSFGVSTLYLAAAVRDNGGGRVIGTEHEPLKSSAARVNFELAGLSDVIELREGDCLESLKHLVGPIDFVLVDIWVEMALPALELIAPHLRPGSVICADNTISAAPSYGAYFEFVRDPTNGMRTKTLPFQGGFEMTVKTGVSCAE